MDEREQIERLMKEIEYLYKRIEYLKIILRKLIT